MKKIKFTCPHCEAKLRVPTHLAGVSAPCPKCGSTITAPSDITEAVYDPSPRRRPTTTRRRPQASSTLSPKPTPQAVQVTERREVSTGVLEASGASANPAISSPVNERPDTLARPDLISQPAQAAPVSAPPVTKPISEPQLERRPLPEPGPAFYTPPPPVRPIVAPEESMEDERSEAPVLIGDDSEVVIEEKPFAETPMVPLSQITQPIQITRMVDSLPEVREVTGGGEGLPRLDISLGGQEPKVVPPPTGVGGGVAKPNRTRVILPQPGEESEQRHPDDFIYSSVPSQAQVEADLETLVEKEKETEDVDLLGIAEGLEAPVNLDVAFDELRYTTVSIPGPDDPISLDDLHCEEEIAASDDVSAEASDYDEMPLDQVAPQATQTSHALEEELHSAPMDLPDFDEYEQPWEAALPEQPSVSIEPSTAWPQTETASVPLQSSLPSPISRRGFPEVSPTTDMPANPLHEGSFGNLFAEQAKTSAEVPALPSPPPLPQTIQPQVESSNERDPLGGIFEPSELEEEKKGLSKSTIALIVAFLIVVGLAIFGMIVVTNAFLGGYTPAEAYTETEEGDASEAKPATDKASVKPKVPKSASNEGKAVEDAPALVDPVAVARDPSTGGAPAAVETNANTVSGSDTPALSFDEKVQQAVGGSRPTSGGSVIGAPSLDLMDRPAIDFSGAQPASSNTGTPPAATQPSEGTGGDSSATAAASASDGVPAHPMAAPKSATKDPNYHPPESFPAPGPEDSKLGKTHDLIDAFLRAPDVETRLKYTYQGDSLRAAVEDYYKKWPFAAFGRYSLQFWEMETETSNGGPYWMYLVSTNDSEQGFPMIVRNEGGLLKADWETFSEFTDQHYVKFREGIIPPPTSLRLIIEQFSDYYGPDRDAFKDLDDYLIYEVGPPYGREVNEYSDYAFVKKGSTVAKKLEELIRLGEDPLAVILTLDRQAFAHGVKHLVITDVSEGWFR